MKTINPRGSQKSSKAAEEDALLPAVSISIVACIVALATVIAFIPSLRNEFVNWDDYETLVNHSRYRGLGWP